MQVRSLAFSLAFMSGLLFGFPLSPGDPFESGPTLPLAPGPADDQREPSFGGLYLEFLCSPEPCAVGASYVVHVYMLDPSDVDGAREFARRSIGPSDFDRSAAEVRVLQADFSLRQLQQWHDELSSVISGVPGLVATDVDERLNRVHLIVETVDLVSAIEQVVREAQIPVEAVVVSVGDRAVVTQLSGGRDRALSSAAIWVIVSVAAMVPVTLMLTVRGLSLVRRPTAAR